MTHTLLSGRQRWLALFLLACILTISSVALAQEGAQEGTPVGEATPPPRGVERTAPPREPVVLSREPDEAGTSDAMRILVAIPASADTYVASGRPSRNFGADALFLGYNLVGDSFGAQRPLLRFDVDGVIPDGSIINEARLNLRLSFSSPSDDPAMATALYNLLSPWDENSVTWNTKPARGDQYAVAPVGSSQSWYEWEITDLVRGWKRGTVANHGVELVGDEAIQERERAFYSRETNTNYYPQLVVDYIDIGDEEPPEVTVDPLPAFSPRTFTVSWSGSDQGSAGIDYYDVEYRVDGGDWQEWLSEVEDTTADFTGESSRTYAFRARGVDRSGNLEPFGGAEASTTVDAAAPTSTIDAMPSIIGTRSFPVNWRGSDAAGIDYYDVQYRRNGGEWILWQEQTEAISAIFDAPQDGLYEFEVRAVDVLGNVEPFHNQAEAQTAVDATPPHIAPASWLPLLFKNGQP